MTDHAAPNTPPQPPLDDHMDRQEVASSQSATDDERAVDDNSEWAAHPDGMSTNTTNSDDLAEQQPDLRTREELLEALAEVQRQRDEYLDDVRRARAEFDNYRRRMMTEGTAQRAAGKIDVAGSLLDALDDLDRTLEAAAASDDLTLAKGVELVASKLRTTLESQGMQRIDESEVPFDPSVHEAVQHQTADEPSEQPRVVQVLRPGYRWDDRVLRAAMVVVEG